MEFAFDSDGFLSDRAGELEAGIRGSHPALFTRALLINRDCHEMLFAADIRNRDGQAIVTATLYMRALEHYQAAILLLGRGMIAPAEVSLRALMETVFRQRAIATDPNALTKFIAEDPAHRRKLINKALNNPYANVDETRKAATPDFLEQLDKEIKETEAKALSSEEWSRLAHMHDWYMTSYALLSKAVHTEVRQLDAYLKRDESEDVKALEYAPSLDEIPLLTLTAAHLILIAASAFDKTFEMGFGPKGDAHIKFVEESLRSLHEGATAPTAQPPP